MQALQAEPLARQEPRLHQPPGTGQPCVSSCTSGSILHNPSSRTAAGLH